MIKQQTDTPTETPEVDAPLDAETLSFLDGLDAGEGTDPPPAGGGPPAPPAPAPAPAPTPNPDDEPPPLAATDERMAKTLEKLQAREEDLRTKAAELADREAKLGPVAQWLEDPAAAFQAAVRAKLGDDEAKAYTNRFVMQIIAEELPELAKALPEDFRYNSELAKIQAKNRELEQRFQEERERAEKEKTEAERSRVARDTQAKIGQVFRQHFAEKHPYLATVPNVEKVIFDYWATRNPTKTPLPKVIEELEAAERQAAERYKDLILAEYGPKGPPPITMQPRRRTAITNGDVGTSKPPKPIEEMTDAESIEYFAAQAEEEAKRRAAAGR